MRIVVDFRIKRDLAHIAVSKVNAFNTRLADRIQIFTFCIRSQNLSGKWPRKYLFQRTTVDVQCISHESLWILNCHQEDVLIVRQNLFEKHIG